MSEDANLDSQESKEIITKNPGCECAKTIAKTGSVCTICRDMSIRDWCLIENYFEMNRTRNEG